MSSSATPLQTVHAYHQRSKHAFQRYAAGPDHLDWATQPNPFRQFAGAVTIELPLTNPHSGPRYAELFVPGKIPAQPLHLRTIARLLEYAFGMAAWKAYGDDRWALRCNPSSGNLHPTEAYVVVGREVAEIASGVYHYHSHDHVLEQRCAAALPFQGVLLGLSSIYWREAWKYGERAFRYCQHDVGHAIGALRYAAALHGWRIELLDDWGDDDIARLLGLDRAEDFGAAEREAPDVLCRIVPASQQTEPLASDALLQCVGTAVWCGHANVLSPRHRHVWPIIDTVHEACRKPRTAPTQRYVAEDLPAWQSACAIAAAALLRQRRSAQAFDGQTPLPMQAFWEILDATLPRAHAPFDCWPWPPRVHLVLFVHRVVGLPAGLYVLCRHSEQSDALLAALQQPEFRKRRVAEAPAHLLLFELVTANCQNAARHLSCHQAIASDSAFSVAMLAEFAPALQHGTWVYRHLFWECGLIGQCLYLEAEAHGVRGTGIGCFFDDPVHNVLGLSGSRYQSLYHFTVGTPLIDTRLQTLPPYAHLPHARLES